MPMPSRARSDTFLISAFRDGWARPISSSAYTFEGATKFWEEIWSTTKFPTAAFRRFGQKYIRFSHLAACNSTLWKNRRYRVGGRPMRSRATPHARLQRHVLSVRETEETSASLSTRWASGRPARKVTCIVTKSARRSERTVILQHDRTGRRKLDLWRGTPHHMRSTRAPTRTCQQKDCTRNWVHRLLEIKDRNYFHSVYALPGDSGGVAATAVALRA